MITVGHREALVATVGDEGLVRKRTHTVWGVHVHVHDQHAQHGGNVSLSKHNTYYAITLWCVADSRGIVDPSHCPLYTNKMAPGGDSAISDIDGTCGESMKDAQNLQVRVSDDLPRLPRLLHAQHLEHVPPWGCTARRLHKENT